MPPPHTDEIVLFDNRESLSRDAAHRIAALAASRAAQTGRFSILLAGGSTPKLLYTMLAEAPFRSAIPWRRVHVFWGDERCVGPDSPDSNYAMARAALLEGVPLPLENIHRIDGEVPAEHAAEAYSEEIEEYLDSLRPADRGFDAAILGVGPDGHCASLFPGHHALDADGFAAASEAGLEPKVDRVTLTFRTFAMASEVLFMAAGADKAPALRSILVERDRDKPARRIRSRSGRVTWLLDRQAFAFPG